MRILSFPSSHVTQFQKKKTIRTIRRIFKHLNGGTETKKKPNVNHQLGSNPLWHDKHTISVVKQSSKRIKINCFRFSLSPVLYVYTSSYILSSAAVPTTNMQQNYNDHTIPSINTQNIKICKWEVRALFSHITLYECQSNDCKLFFPPINIKNLSVYTFMPTSYNTPGTCVLPEAEIYNEVFLVI